MATPTAGRFQATRMGRPVVFVFGSNRQGRHGSGAALEAKLHWGAITGQACGRQGESYAIVTKELRANYQPVTLDQIQRNVDEFLSYVKERTWEEFIVTAIGCGLAGFKPAQIAPMFRGAPPNVFLPAVFMEVLRD